MLLITCLAAGVCEIGTSYGLRPVGTGAGVGAGAGAGAGGGVLGKLYSAGGGVGFMTC